MDNAKRTHTDWIKDVAAPAALIIGVPWLAVSGILLFVASFCFIGLIITVLSLVYYRPTRDNVETGQTLKWYEWEVSANSRVYYLLLGVVCLAFLGFGAGPLRGDIFPQGIIVLSTVWGLHDYLNRRRRIRKVPKRSRIELIRLSTLTLIPIIGWLLLLFFSPTAFLNTAPILLTTWGLWTYLEVYHQTAREQEKITSRRRKLPNWRELIFWGELIITVVFIVNTAILVLFTLVPPTPNFEPLIIAYSTLLLILTGRSLLLEKRSQLALEAQSAELAKSYSKLQETYDELKRTQAQLVQSEKMAGLGQLVAGVAHEINNPVNFISSSLTPLERNLNVILQIFDELDKVYELQLPELEPVLQRVDALAAQLDYEAAREAIPKILSAMREGTDRTTEIVQSLRTFARHGEAGKAPADLHTGLDATLTLLQNRLKRGIVVHKDYGNLPQVTFDAGQINQVFMNLLTNAADAIKAEGEIFITTQHVERSEIPSIGLGENVEIRVRDTGCGIPTAVKDKLFDPFFSTKEVGSGMGLGLWICHQIVVEGHGGEIDVQSEVGKGTEFVVTLPITPKETQHES